MTAVLTPERRSEAAPAGPQSTSLRVGAAVRWLAGDQLARRAGLVPGDADHLRRGHRAQLGLRPADRARPRRHRAGGRRAARGRRIVAAPRDLFYGQRQLLLTDPDGALADVSSTVTPAGEFTAGLVQDGEAIRLRG